MVSLNAVGERREDNLTLIVDKPGSCPDIERVSLLNCYRLLPHNSCMVMTKMLKNIQPSLIRRCKREEREKGEMPALKPIENKLAALL